MNEEARSTKALALANAVRMLESKLDNLKLEHDRTTADLQMIFRKFVTDKQFAIGDRFRTWAGHCLKEHPEVSICDGFGLIGRLASEADEYSSRDGGVVYTWEYFLDLVTDRNDYPDEYDGNYQDVTVDDIKEALIAENFGSFKEDF